MTLSRFAQYALHATLDMAAAGDAPVTVAHVARTHGISPAALAKVFQQLVRGGLAASTRGIGGGYRLARPREAVTVLDVVSLFESVRPGGGVAPDDLRRATAATSPHARALRLLFDEVDENVRTTLASVSLETLVRDARQDEAAVAIRR